MLCPPPSAILKNFWSLGRCFDKHNRAFIGWAVSRDQLAPSLNVEIFRTGKH